MVPPGCAEDQKYDSGPLWFAGGIAEVITDHKVVVLHDQSSTALQIQREAAAATSGLSAGLPPFGLDCAG